MSRAYVGAFLAAALVASCGSSDGNDLEGSGGSAGAAGAGTGGSAGSGAGGGAGASGSGGAAGTGGASGAGGGGGSAGAGGSSGGGGAGGAGITCPSTVAAPGDQTIAITFGGVARDYILHVPAGYAGTSAVPLVMNFHGYTSNAAQEQIWTGMNAKSDAAGFVVAYPNGIDMSWNAGACCGTAASSGVDDVGFVRAVVADIESKACIDTRRVYATGMSNGGFLSHRLGCEASDLFAAIAPVAGTMGIAACNPTRPVPVIDFHGTADSLVPYSGIAATIDGWASRDGCTDSPVQTFQNGTATCETRSACSKGVKVTLCSLTGEGHCWPGQAYCPFGAGTTDLSANDAMWDFFGQFTLD